MANSRTSSVRGGVQVPGSTTGGLPGVAPQSGTGLGLVPNVPDPTQTQQQAIQGNIGNLGSLYGLTNSLNTEVAGQAALPYQLNLPNYNQMTQDSSQNILAQLQGQVPQDVSNQLQQLAAERGISTGSIGSPNSNTALLRSLGLTSIGQQQQGEANLTSAIARTPTGQQFNPQNFLVTPSQQQEAQYMQSLYNAAPSPSAVASAGLGAARSGITAGIGSGASYHAPGMGATDALGFPISSSDMAPGYGPDQIYGATGVSSPSTENANSWNQWNASMPWNAPGGNTPNGNMSGVDTGGDPFQTGDQLDNYTGPIWQGGDFTDNSNMFADMGDY